MKLPPLRALPVFEAVSRLNSFSRAATELNISQSAVSHQIKQLEDYLGERLFHRSGRYLSLTDDGRHYLENVTSALQQIERASEALLGHTDTRLRLAVFSSFSVRWLIPRLPTLKQAHPQIELILEMTNENPVLSDRVGDCFITIRHDQPAFSYDLLYTERLFPICSRRFWQQLCQDLDIDSAAPPALPASQIARYPLLSTYSIYDQESRDWQEWFRTCGDSLPASARVQQFSHMLLALEAARHHQGISLTNDYMLQTTDSHDDLVRIPSHTLTTGDQFFFAHKTSRRNEPAIQQLRHWLIGQAVASGLLQKD